MLFHCSPIISFIKSGCATELKTLLVNNLLVWGEPYSPYEVNSEICLLSFLLVRYIIPYMAETHVSTNQHDIKYVNGPLKC